MDIPQYSIQQSQFQSPPVLYSQSQPMMVTNQNNMSYQMVNLGAGAMMQRLKQRQEEEMLVDMLAKQNELITQLAEDMNWRLDKKQKEMDEELEMLERKVIIAKQKKAEQDYLFKLNRQLNFGLERIKEQEIKRLVFPKPLQLALKVPSIAKHEELEQVYPNKGSYSRDFMEQGIQANAAYEYNNPYGPFAQLSRSPKYSAQFDQQREQRISAQRLSQMQAQRMSAQQMSQYQGSNAQFNQQQASQSIAQNNYRSSNKSLQSLQSAQKSNPSRQSIKSPLTPMMQDSMN